MAKSTIQDLAQRVGFKGRPQHRIAEPSEITSIRPINNAIPTQPTIRTSLDCYVSGQYTQRGGKILEVTQRYTIFVAYSLNSQTETMREVRNRIMRDFQERYGHSFNITTIFVPALLEPEPISQKAADPAEMYGGSELFREMTRYERARYDIETEREKSRLNIQSIRDRYGADNARRYKWRNE